MQRAAIPRFGVQIPARDAQILVPQRILPQRYRRAPLQRVRGMGMPQPVR